MRHRPRARGGVKCPLEIVTSQTRGDDHLWRTQQAGEGVTVSDGADGRTAISLVRPSSARLSHPPPHPERSASTRRSLVNPHHGRDPSCAPPPTLTAHAPVSCFCPAHPNRVSGLGLSSSSPMLRSSAGVESREVRDSAARPHRRAVSPSRQLVGRVFARAAGPGGACTERREGRPRGRECVAVGVDSDEWLG